MDKFTSSILHQEKPKILLKAQGIFKSFPQGVGELSILKGIDLEVYEGDAVSIMGASGSGKSTLLQILGTLDHPNSGVLYFREQNLFTLDDEKLSEFRNQKMGFVFQFHHLISEFSAVENVMIPARIAGENLKVARSRAEELLSMMGLTDRFEHYPNQLSGGELQRVAIARALMRRPEILFADEPTGNLDSVNSQKVQELFFELRKKLGVALVIVTHDQQFAQKFPKVLKLKDGQWMR